jgi:PEP-CTERM motif
MNNRWLLTAAALLGLLAATHEARASILLPGATDATVSEADPLLGSTILANTGLQSFNITNPGTGDVFAGTGQAWVVSGYSGNPNGLSDLTFVYQVSLSSSPPTTSDETIERVSMSNFGLFSTDVGYNQTGAQVIPATADRTSNGSTVGFNFLSTGAIDPGETSALLIVNTNATAFKMGGLTVQDTLTANLNGFSPTAVPEPSSVVAALSGLALCGVASWRRRFRKVS